MIKMSEGEKETARGPRITNFQRRVLIAVGRGHASAQEAAAEIGTTPNAVGKAMMLMTRTDPQIMHASGADENLPVPDVTDACTWDANDNDRLQLTEYGLSLLPAKLKLVLSDAP